MKPITFLLTAGLSSFFLCLNSFKSVDSNAVVIGAQVWTVKNLDVTTFRNGDTIPEKESTTEWLNANKNKQPAWCYYDGKESNGKKYGKLYNWYAVNDPRGLAPTGWHIPADTEWSILINYLGREVAGGNLKSHVWGSECIDDNKSGFSALPAGDRAPEGTFVNLGKTALFWTTTQKELSVLIRYLDCPNSIVYGAMSDKGGGISCRCIKD